MERGTTNSNGNDNSCQKQNQQQDIQQRQPQQDDIQQQQQDNIKIKEQSILKEDFFYEKHIQYFVRSLNCLSYHYAGNDQNRLMFCHFCVNGLDTLNAIDRVPRQDVIDWIYRQQVFPSGCNNNNNNNNCNIDNSNNNNNCSIDNNNNNNINNNNNNDFLRCGFRGGPFYVNDSSILDTGHIAMTYVAIATLHTLGDDLSRLKKNEIIMAIKSLQQLDGSYESMNNISGEKDMRFVYCACSISHLLQDWSGVNQNKVIEYVKSCITYDGGIGLLPGLESHGGSLYTALASLYLIDSKLEMLSNKEKDEMIYWCLQRQVLSNGFQGRCNKDPDTCYSFWVGASLKILKNYHLIDLPKIRSFQILNQNKFMGGFGKIPENPPDILHSYYSIASLAISGETGLKSFDVILGKAIKENDEISFSF